MIWLVLARNVRTNVVYPYGPFNFRDDAVAWSEGQFTDDYEVSFNWIRSPK